MKISYQILLKHKSIKYLETPIVSEICETIDICLVQILSPFSGVISFFIRYETHRVVKSSQLSLFSMLWVDIFLDYTTKLSCWSFPSSTREFSQGSLSNWMLLYILYGTFSAFWAARHNNVPIGQMKLWESICLAFTNITEIHVWVWWTSCNRPIIFADYLNVVNLIRSCKKSVISGIKDKCAVWTKVHPNWKIMIATAYFKMMNQ